MLSELVPGDDSLVLCVVLIERMSGWEPCYQKPLSPEQAGGTSLAHGAEDTLELFKTGSSLEGMVCRKDLGQRGPGWEGGRAYLQEQVTSHPSS